MRANVTYEKVEKRRKKEKIHFQIKTIKFALNEDIFLIYFCEEFGVEFAIFDITK